MSLVLAPAVVAVGSTNPVKVEPVRSVLVRAFPEAKIVPIEVASGVPEQPIGLEQMRLGAQNRAAHALEEVLSRNQQADGSAVWSVGLEGGIDFEGEIAWLTGVVAIVTERGRVSFAWSPRIALPPLVAEALRAGRELGPVMDELSGVTDSKKKLGALGFLTNGLAPRGVSWEMAFACALAPFLHPELYP
jgi:inosine/xanthosine triphosphatase